MRAQTAFSARGIDKIRLFFPVSAASSETAIRGFSRGARIRPYIQN